MQLIDTHIHLNFSTFEADLESVRSRWQEVGVVQLVHSCVHPGEFTEIRTLADRFPELFFAVGLHPLDTERWTPAMLQEIQDFAQSDPRVVAIGELGLDFYKAQDQALQQDICAQQLRLAVALDKPVIIHCRDAAAPMAQLLTQIQDEVGLPVRGVMHCWSGSPEETQWFLDRGLYISFSGIVTFKNAKQVKASAQLVPDDRLLIETDCPFLAPMPYRGKRNEPSYVYHVATTLAQLRNTTLDAIAHQTTTNARQLFKLPIPALKGDEFLSV
ncbi:MAG: TatD family hydrolase [Spirulina sp. SIO3F2]|nr:TatD family hydrolase [Spirulina sp. SIO3F2]